MTRFAVTRFGLIILLVLLLSGLLGVWLASRPDAGAGEIRNVLLISIDTCRADHLSCYGYKSKTTPNIDALAAEGILFENVIAPYPLTLPSHSSMLTGTIPPYHGVHANMGGYLADDSNITLPEILKDAGFATVAAVSGFSLKSQFGISQGFDDYYEHFENTDEGGRGQERKGAETTDLALEWLKKNKDKRFFFFLHYFDPHEKYEPPQPFASKFADDAYAGEIAFADHCIGRVLDKLKELDLYDSTLVIITSDHGEMLGEHGEPTHSYFIYQGAIKVPLIFKLPGQNEEVRIKSIAGLVDIVPTVCGLLGIETPKNVQGLDLFARSQEENTSGPGRGIYCESLYPTKYKANSLLGIVNDRYKYIQTTRPELYDLLSDPGESNNLAAKENQRARIMQDKLAQMLEQTVRKASGDSKVEMAPGASAQLKALGYVGGTVTEDFSFDQIKADPKDLLEYHVVHIRSQAKKMTKEYDKVRMFAEQMIQLQPNLPFGYDQLGVAALIQKDYDKAIVCFQKAIELAPENPDIVEAYYQRGNAYQDKGELDLAIDDYNQALKLDPRLVEAYNNRGITYSRKGELDRAIRDLDRVIELDPSYTDAYSNRGLAYLRKGDLDRGIRDLDQVIKLNPGLVGAYHNRGTARRTKGNLDLAIADYNQIIKLNPRSPEAYYNRGITYQIKGELDLAIDDYNQTVKLNPRHALAYNNRGSAYQVKGELDLAIDSYNQAIKVNPSDAQAYNNRGSTYLRKGEYDRAIRDFDKVITLNPKYAQAYNNRGSAYQAKGESEQAIGDYNQAIKLNPRHDKAYYNRGLSYKSQGQHDKAIRDFEKALQLAQANGNQSFAKYIQSNLKLYKANRP